MEFKFSYAILTKDAYAKPFVVIPIESINVDNITIPLGETLSLILNVTPTNANSAITVKIANDEIASVSNNSLNPKQFIVEALKQGTTTITFESGEVKKEITIKVFKEISFEIVADDKSLISYEDKTDKKVKVTFTDEIKYSLEGNSLKIIGGENGESKTFTPALTEEGYKFEGWYIDGEKINEKGTTNTNSNFTINTTPIKYKIELKDINGNLLEDEGSREIMNNEYSYTDTIILPNIEPSEGYKFSGWYKDDNKVETFSKLTSEDGNTVSLVAKFEEIKYTLKFSEGVDDLELTYTQEFILPVLEKEGYTFRGWYRADNDTLYNGGDNINRITITDNDVIFLKASWEGGEEEPEQPSNQTYQLILQDQFNSYDNITLGFDEEYTLPTPDNREGYTFECWMREDQRFEGGQTIYGLSYNEGEEVILVAVYNEEEPEQPSNQTYQLILQDQFNSYDNITLGFDEEYTLPTPDNQEGYTFECWMREDQRFEGGQTIYGLSYNEGEEVILVAVYNEEQPETHNIYIGEYLVQGQDGESSVETPKVYAGVCGDYEVPSTLEEAKSLSNNVTLNSEVTINVDYNYENTVWVVLNPSEVLLKYCNNTPPSENPLTYDLAMGITDRDFISEDVEITDLGDGYQLYVYSSMLGFDTTIPFRLLVEGETTELPKTWKNVANEITTNQSNGIPYENLDQMRIGSTYEDSSVIYTMNSNGYVVVAVPSEVSCDGIIIGSRNDMLSMGGDEMDRAEEEINGYTIYYMNEDYIPYSQLTDIFIGKK